MPNGSSEISEEELDKLLQDVEGVQAAEKTEAASPSLAADVPLETPNRPSKKTGMGLDQASLNSLVDSFGQEEAGQESGQLEQKDEQLDLSALSDPGKGSSEKIDNIELLKDVFLRFTVELGHTRMLVQDVLKLGRGSIVELDREHDEDVDILVNNRLFARGKLKLVGEYYGVQITRIENPMSEYRKSATP